MASQVTQQRIRQSARQARQQSDLIVREYPVVSSLAVFGLGLGIGVALAQLSGGLPTRQESGLAHRLGRQMLDSLGSLVPESAWSLKK